jgi:hypothetical protein
MLLRRFAYLSNKFSTNKSLNLLNSVEKEEYLKRLEENAFVDYKVYPLLPHQDPKSPEYIAS